MIIVSFIADGLCPEGVRAIKKHVICTNSDCGAYFNADKHSIHFSMCLIPGEEMHCSDA